MTFDIQTALNIYTVATTNYSQLTAAMTPSEIAVLHTQDFLIDLDEYQLILCTSKWEYSGTQQSFGFGVSISHTCIISSSGIVGSSLPITLPSLSSL